MLGSNGAVREEQKIESFVLMLHIPVIIGLILTVIEQLNYQYADPHGVCKNALDLMCALTRPPLHHDTKTRQYRPCSEDRGSETCFMSELPELSLPGMPSSLSAQEVIGAILSVIQFHAHLKPDSRTPYVNYCNLVYRAIVYVYFALGYLATIPDILLRYADSEFDLELKWLIQAASFKCSILRDSATGKKSLNFDAGDFKWLWQPVSKQIEMDESFGMEKIYKKIFFDLFIASVEIKHFQLSKLSRDLDEHSKYFDQQNAKAWLAKALTVQQRYKHTILLIESLEAAWHVPDLVPPDQRPYSSPAVQRRPLPPYWH